MHVYIMRGIPGSGKSTWAKASMKSGDKKVSADDYFMWDDGIYRFDPSRIGHAHSYCLATFTQIITGYVEDSYDVYVDNTNISAWEIAPYYQLATAFGWRATIINIKCDQYDAFMRQTHSVPKSTFGGMVARLIREKLPAHWNVSNIDTNSFTPDQVGV